MNDSGNKPKIGRTEWLRREKRRKQFIRRM